MREAKAEVARCDLSGRDAGNYLEKRILLVPFYAG